MIRINLLAPESIKKEERKEIFALACAVVVVICLIGAAKYVMLFGSYKKLSGRINRTQAELNKYESIVKQVEALQATKSVLVTKKNVISTLMAGRLIYPVYMEKIMEVLPQNVWFKSMNTQMDADGIMTITLSAEALDNYAIADFITGLSSCPDFSEVELGPIATSNSQKMQTSVFNLTFKYKKKS